MEWSPTRAKAGEEPPIDMKIAIVLICHEGYLPFLKEAIGSIDGQSVPFGQKILVIDTADAPDWVRGWDVIRKDAQNPNPCRNAGLDKAADADWIVFWDADNTMHRDYHSCVRWKAKNADANVGVLFPNLYYFGGIEKVVSPPDWSEDSVSTTNCWDTSSAWRREAIAKQRWDEGSLCHDDWSLALRLMRDGWVGDRLNTHVNVRHHHTGGQRRSVAGWANLDKRREQMLWKIRTLAVCTVFSRPENVDAYFKQLETLELPERKSLYILDNSGDERCHATLATRMAALEGWESVTLMKDGTPMPEIRDDEKQHQRRLENIAEKTNKLWTRVREDILLSIDDDCFAVEPDAVKRMHYELRPKASAVVGAAYKSKRAKGALVATFGNDSYGRPIAEDFAKVAQVGGVGAGFTMYLRASLRHAFPIRMFDQGGKRAGHDYNVCYLIRQKGGSITLDATVKVDHV